MAITLAYNFIPVLIAFLPILLFGGAGGDWTLVQTGTSCAFYTLIPAFGFRVQTRPGPPICTLSSKFHPQREAIMSYPRFCCATLPGRFGATAPEWHLVSAPSAEIKPVIYCASIRQRERNCFRQINSWQSLIIESGRQLSACLHNTSSCCQIQSAPMC